MKKLLTVLLMLMLLPMLFACGEKLPPDYVQGDAIVIDNTTPFVYTENPPGSTAPYLILSIIRGEDMWSYSDFAAYYGAKIIRHYVMEDTDYYYTVYSLPDNSLAYIWMQPDEKGILRISHPFNEWCLADARNLYTDMPVFEYDRPPAILGDRMPLSCQKESYTFEEIAKNTEHQWQMYSDRCSAAGLETYFNIKHAPDVRTFYRCMQSVAFDEKSADGLYVYDLIQYRDGTAALRFRHLYDHQYPQYTLEQDTTIPLTAEETETILHVFEEEDFENIPTWNPEEYTGFDGETTFVHGDSEHLIAMWCAGEQYGIYKIRTAFENIVKNHTTVTSGRIFAD